VIVFSHDEPQCRADKEPADPAECDASGVGTQRAVLARVFSDAYNVMNPRVDDTGHHEPWGRTAMMNVTRPAICQMPKALTPESSIP
jgi:hypothetical protein